MSAEIGQVAHNASEDAIALFHRLDLPEPAGLPIGAQLTPAPGGEHRLARVGTILEGALAAKA
jgi:hypothetical protein